MSKSKAPDINRMLLEAHKIGVKRAVEMSARSKIPLVVYENGRIKLLKPKFKYIRVPVETSKKKQTLTSSVLRRKK